MQNTVKKRNKNIIYHLCFSAVFVALIAVCAMVSIPVGNVKFTLQLLAVLLCAGLLPLYDSLPAIGAYILLGALGAPVFAGFTGGFAALAGPTGGFIYGFLLTDLAVFFMLLLWKKRTFPLLCAAFAVGTFFCHLCGTLHFLLYMPEKGLLYALSVCVLPYLLPDCAKILLAALIVARVRPYLEKLLNKNAK